MRTLIFSLAISALLISCNNDKSKEPVKETTTTPQTTEQVAVPAVDSTAFAKKWLTDNIEQFFSNFDKLEGDYSKICTKEYFNYKTDATNVEMGDDGMTKAKFEKKWPNRTTGLAGIGAGFMVSAQDFGKIKVTKCEFLNRTLTGGYFFGAVIEDIQFKLKYKREIVVVQNKGAFLIDDVLEYD